MSSALVASVFAAAGTSCYACLSCTLFNIRFTSTDGSFEEMYLDPRAGSDVPLPHSVSVGLFSWLDSSRGICRGYTQNQIAAVGDNILQASRFLSVFVVILSLFASVWALSFVCMSYGHCRMIALCLLLGLQCILVALLFLVKQSSLCSSIGENSSCSLDEGGLVASAASMLWFVAFCIAFFFVEAIPDSSSPKLTQHAIEDRERRANRRKDREAVRKKRIARKIAAEQESEWIEEGRRRGRAKAREREALYSPGNAERTLTRTPDTEPSISASPYGDVVALYEQRVRSHSPAVDSPGRLSDRMADI